ncbi:HD domain-containing phosphohydrolase [Ottowia caeni]|uniref:HD domain-containing phosphohydrolase n=1 Tax=Ottowia caeni TaxID=2870339 RepID=UPI001E4739A0|nr:PAS domain S-box protein [Ottowia caeni]
MANKLTADIRAQEQRIKEDEFRWNFALDGSGIGVWDRDFQTGKVFYSSRSAQLLGYDDEKIGSSVDAWQQRIDPRDQPVVLRQLQAYLDGHAPEFDATYRLQLENGRQHWVRDRGTSVLRSESGKPVRMIGTFSDVSDQMHSTMRIQQLAGLNAVMSECNAAIVRCTTQDQLFERITQVVVESGHVKMCWIGLADPQTGLIQPVHAFGSGTEYLQGIEISVNPDDPRGQGATGTAIRVNQPVWIEDFRTDPRTLPWRDRARQYGWLSSAALPIARAGRAIGALTFYDDKAGWYDPEVRTLLEGMAAQIGFAVDKYDVQAEVQAHQKRVLEASAHLQQVLEAMPVPIQIFSLTEQKFRFINQAHRHWLGYELEDVASLSQWFAAVYSPEVGQARLKSWEKTFQTMQPGQPVEMPETMLHGKGGSVLVGRVRATLVGDDIVLTWIDLTGIRRQEPELRESERRFRSMVEKAVTGMYVRRDRKLIYANESFCQMLGRSTDELLGHELTEFADVSPQEWEKVMQAWDQLEAGRRNVPIEVKLLHKDGTAIEVGIQLSPIEWDDGQTAVIGLADDITARKRAAEQIDTYVHRLEASLQATLRAVATMVEMRDPYTAGHERRVGLLAAAIAEEMGWPSDRFKTLEMVGLVHDVGKIAVPAEILVKPTRLTPIEMQLVREHAQAGFDILKDVPFDVPVAEIIRQHHERMDGSGYPQGLKGDEILPEARVLAVADVLESMAAHRPYRPALGMDVALKELEQGRGRLYDSDAVDAVVRLIRDKAYVLPQ